MARQPLLPAAGHLVVLVPWGLPPSHHHPFSREEDEQIRLRDVLQSTQAAPRLLTVRDMESAAATPEELRDNMATITRVPGGHRKDTRGHCG